MSLWGKVFAAGYERVLAPSEAAGLADRRREVLSHARGRVLEVGPGPGMNLSHYPPEIGELVLAEPEEPMARRLERRLTERGIGGSVVRAPADALPFEDGSFDTVVSTFVLCTVPDAEAALRELRRVVRDGGALLFLEHVRSSDSPRLAAWQDRLETPWRWFAHGCHCNRRTAETLESSPFEVERLDPGQVPKASPLVRPMISGRARARARG